MTDRIGNRLSNRFNLSSTKEKQPSNSKGKPTSNSNSNSSDQSINPSPSSSSSSSPPPHVSSSTNLSYQIQPDFSSSSNQQRSYDSDSISITSIPSSFTRTSDANRLILGDDESDTDGEIVIPKNSYPFKNSRDEQDDDGDDTETETETEDEDSLRRDSLDLTKRVSIKGKMKQAEIEGGTEREVLSSSPQSQLEWNKALRRRSGSSSSPSNGFRNLSIGNSPSRNATRSLSASPNDTTLSRVVREREERDVTPNWDEEDEEDGFADQSTGTNWDESLNHQTSNAYASLRSTTSTNSSNSRGVIPPLHHYSEEPFASTSSLVSRSTVSPTSTPGGSAMPSPANLPMQLPPDEYPTSHPYMEPENMASSSSLFKSHQAAVSESWDEDFLFQHDDEEGGSSQPKEEERKKSGRGGSKKKVEENDEIHDSRREVARDDDGRMRWGKRKKGKEISNSGTPRALNKRMEIGHEDEDEDDWDQNFLPQDSIDPKRKEELIGISNSNSSRTITDASHALGSSGLRLTSNSHQNSNSRDQQNKLSHSRSQSSTSTTSTNTSTQSGKSLALTDISGRLARQSDVSSWRTRRSSGSEEGNDDLDLSLSADLERRPISWNTNGSGSGSGGNGSEGSKTGDERLGWPASLNPVNREEKSEGNRNSQRSSTSGQTDALRWEMGIPLDGERRSWGSNALRDDLMEIGDEEEEGVPRPISGVNGSLRQRSSQTSWTGEEPTRRHALYVSADGAGATGSGSDTESAPSLNGESGDETETESALGLSDVLQSGKKIPKKKTSEREVSTSHNSISAPLSTSASSSTSTSSAVKRLSAAASRAFPLQKKLSQANSSTPTSEPPQKNSSRPTHSRQLTSPVNSVAISKVISNASAVSLGANEEISTSPPSGSKTGRGWNPFKGSRFSGSAASTSTPTPSTSKPQLASEIKLSNSRSPPSASDRLLQSPPALPPKEASPSRSRKNLSQGEDRDRKDAAPVLPPVPSPSKDKEKIKTKRLSKKETTKDPSKHKNSKSLSMSFGLSQSKTTVPSSAEPRVSKEKLISSSTSPNLGSMLFSNPKASASSSSLSSVKAVVGSGRDRQPSSSTSGSGKSSRRREKEREREKSSGAQTSSSARKTSSSALSRKLSGSGTLRSETSKDSFRRVTGKRRGSEALGASEFSGTQNQTSTSQVDPGSPSSTHSQTGSGRRIVKGRPALRGDGYNGPSAATSPLLSHRSTSNSTATTSASGNGSDAWADTLAASQTRAQRRAGEGSWGSETSYSYGSSQEKDSAISPGALAMDAFISSRRTSTTSDSDTSTRGVAGSNRILNRAPRFTVRRKGTDPGSPSLAQVNESQQINQSDLTTSSGGNSSSNVSSFPTQSWPTVPALFSHQSSEAVPSRKLQYPSPTMQNVKVGPKLPSVGQAKDNSMRRNSLGDLRIPARISKAQEGLRANIGFVRDFAKGIEELKTLQASYRAELLSSQGNPEEDVSDQALTTNLKLSPESQLRVSQLEEEFATWWECADVLVGLGEGRSEADDNAEVDNLTHSPMTSRERRITMETPQHRIATPNSLGRSNDTMSSGSKGVARSGASSTGKTSSMSGRSVHPQREMDILQAMLAGTPPSFDQSPMRLRSRVDSERDSGAESAETGSVHSSTLFAPQGSLQGAAASATSLTFADSVLPDRSERPSNATLRRQSQPHHPYHTAPSSVSPAVFAAESTDSLSDPAAIGRGGRQRLRSASRAGLQGLRELLKTFKIASPHFGSEWAISKESLHDGSLGRSSSKLGRHAGEKEGSSSASTTTPPFFPSAGPRRRSIISKMGLEPESTPEESATSRKESPVRRRSYLFRKVSDDAQSIAPPASAASTPDRSRHGKAGSSNADISADSGWTIGSDFDSPGVRSSISSDTRGAASDAAAASSSQAEGVQRRRLFSLGMGMIGSRPRGNSVVNKQQPPTSSASAAALTSASGRTSQASDRGPPSSSGRSSPISSRSMTEEERRNRRVSIQGYPSAPSGIPRFPSSGSGSRNPLLESKSSQFGRSFSAASAAPSSPSRSISNSNSSGRIQPSRASSASAGRPASERVNGSASTVDSSVTASSGDTNSTSGEWANRINVSIKTDPAAPSPTLSVEDSDGLSSHERYRKLALRPEAIPSLLIYVQATRQHCADCLVQLQRLHSTVQSIPAEKDAGLQPSSARQSREGGRPTLSNPPLQVTFQASQVSNAPSSTRLRSLHERSASATAISTLRYSSETSSTPAQDSQATIRAKSPTSPTLLPDLRMPPPSQPRSSPSSSFVLSRSNTQSTSSRSPFPRSQT